MPVRALHSEDRMRQICTLIDSTSVDDNTCSSGRIPLDFSHALLAHLDTICSLISSSLA